MSSLHYSAGIPTKLESSDKSIGTMRKFTEQYARHSRTYFSVDKGVTSCVNKLQAKFQVTCRRYSGESAPKNIYCAALLSPWFGSRKSKKDINLGLWSLAAESNQVATNSADKESGNAEKAVGDDRLLVNNPPILNSTANGSEHEPNGKVKVGTQTLDASNSTGVSSDVKRDTPSSQKIQKRSSLTAREKLRAARVLKRDTEPKPSEFGSKVLDALRESERGKKRSRLPEAPTNLLDDSKRGMPKQGLTFDFPGGFDLFVIVLSFVLITTTMVATTYIVWKLGAIHFNDN